MHMETSPICTVVYHQTGFNLNGSIGLELVKKCNEDPGKSSITQATFTCSKLKIKTLVQNVKYVQS